MSENTGGLRRILSHPAAYEFLQNLLGGEAARKEIVARYLRPEAGHSLLDIGCGPAEILSLLPDGIDYTGFDASADYIESARRRFGDRGHFYQEYVSDAVLQDIGKFDLVLASGLLHHLDDEEVRTMSQMAYDALKPGGRFLTVDPAFETGQSPISRFLIRNDRGQNVRSSRDYCRLIEDNLAWSRTTVEVRHDLLRFPYTHAIVECQK